jgi:hypothetical protein
MHSLSIPLTISTRVRVAIPDELDGAEREAALYLARMVGVAGLIDSTNPTPETKRLWFEKAGAKFRISPERASEIAASLQFEGRDTGVPVRIRRKRRGRRGAA